MDLNELIVSAAKYIVAWGMTLYAASVAWKTNCKTRETEAKENSVGAQALKDLSDRLEILEDSYTEKKFTDKRLQEIVTNLETNYSNLMRNVFDMFSKR